MTVRLTVLDFGMGNLRSVAKALERTGATAEVSETIDEGADALVVPGQGAFGSCVVNLGARLDGVRAWIEAGRPYLGICLGLQLLLDSSEESTEKGLGIVAGTVPRFPDGLTVPHIGWNEVVPRAGSRLFAGIEPGTRFYFVHSYYPSPAGDDAVAATTDHGLEFACALESGAMFATQFHPEKSGDAGHALLQNFVSAVA